MNDIEVLIIEDNIKITRTHQAFIDKIDGFIVTGIANTLEEANLLVETLEPDLILLDNYFPVSSGIDFLRQLRSSGKEVDVILITAAREVETLHSAMHGGAFDYMIKPVFFDRFRESLDNYRLRRIELATATDLSQEDADRLLGKMSPSGAQYDEDTPKGIDGLTLEKIIAVFQDKAQGPISATEMGDRIGVSRTTARKYMEYLVSAGTLHVNLDYTTKGRPERRYLLVI